MLPPKKTKNKKKKVKIDENGTFTGTIDDLLYHIFKKYGNEIAKNMTEEYGCFKIHNKNTEKNSSTNKDNREL